MHAITAAARGLGFERLRHVFLELRRIHWRDIAVRLLEDNPANLLVGDAIDKHLLVTRHLLDGVADDTGSLKEKRERIEQTRGRLLADVVRNDFQHRILRPIRREASMNVYSLQWKLGQFR